MFLLKGIIEYISSKKLWSVYHLRESCKIFNKFESLENKLLESLKTNTLITQQTQLEINHLSKNTPSVNVNVNEPQFESASKIR